MHTFLAEKVTLRSPSEKRGPGKLGGAVHTFLKKVTPKKRPKGTQDILNKSPKEVLSPKALGPGGP